MFTSSEYGILAKTAELYRHSIVRHSKGLSLRQPYQVWLRSDEKWTSYRVCNLRGPNFTENDVTDDVMITKFIRVLHFTPWNSPVKFHQDRIGFSRVMVFKCKC